MRVAATIVLATRFATTWVTTTWVTTSQIVITRIASREILILQQSLDRGIARNKWKWMKDGTSTH
jgi:hypothetical protein